MRCTSAKKRILAPISNRNVKNLLGQQTKNSWKELLQLRLFFRLRKKFIELFPTKFFVDPTNFFFRVQRIHNLRRNSVFQCLKKSVDVRFLQ